MELRGNGRYRCPVASCGATVSLRDPAAGRGLSASSKHDDTEGRDLKPAGRLQAARMERDRRIRALSGEGRSAAEIAASVHLSTARVAQIVRARLAPCAMGVAV